MDNLINDLKCSNLFNNLSTLDIEQVLSKIKYKKIDLVKNEYVFDTFSTSNYVGLVLCGNINIEKLLPSGKLISMYSKKKGDIFGEVAAFSDIDHYPCNVISTTKSSLILFNKNEFFELISLNQTILQNFLTLISNKALDLNKRIGTLSFSSAREKLTQSLLYDFKLNEDLVIKLPFSKQHWANTLNISRASLYRELNTLCEELVINLNTSSNIIKILDLEKLEAIIFT